MLYKKVETESDGSDVEQSLLSENNEKTLVTYNEAVTEILSQAFYIGASYTGSFSFIVVAILAGHIKDNDDTDVDYLSTTTLITSIMYPTIIIGTSSIFAVLYYMLNKLGQYSNCPEGSEKERHKTDIARLVKNIFLFSIISLPAVVTLLVFFLKKQIMQSLFSQNQSDIDHAQQYLDVAIWMTLFFAIRVGFEQILFPFNKQKEVMTIALLTFGVFDVLLAALLCYTFNLKLLGVAIAFLIGEFVTALAFGVYLNTAADLKKFQFFNVSGYDAEDLKQVWELITIGSSITISISSEWLAFFIINLFSGWLGRDELAAQDLASQVFFITFIPSFAIAQVAAMRTGGAIGAKEYENAVRYARSGLLAVGLILGVVCLIPLLAYPSLMRYLITNDAGEQVEKLSDSAVRIAAVTAFFMAMSNVLLQTVRCYDPKDFTPTFISASAAFLGVAFAHILGFEAKLGLNGVLGGYGIGIATGAFTLFGLSSQKIEAEALRLRPVS